MQGPGCSIPAGGRAPVRLTVNGRACEAQVESGLLLVDLLRDHLGLKGTHVGCLTGDCGACTVLLDGRSAKACTVLAGSAQGAEVITLEGLGTPAGLHPVQQAFWECHGFQCGFCLPGMVFAAVELLEENADPTAAEVKDALSGNLCRCTGYQPQVAAVLAAARRMRE
jgi:aerobic-type carbon monoxide dehydrogenase small subunit (CoxS/CutS family)